MICCDLGRGVWRQRCLDSWKRSPIGLLRSFTQFYEKMGTFVYYSHVEEADSPHGHEVS